MIECYFCGKQVRDLQTAVDEQWWPSVWEIDHTKQPAVGELCVVIE